MKKTSIYLDPELDAALARRADEEGLTKAELIRRTLAHSMQPARRPKFVGIGTMKGAPPDLAENLEKYLLEDGFGE